MITVLSISDAQLRTRPPRNYFHAVSYIGYAPPSSVERYRNRRSGYYYAGYRTSYQCRG